jgi:hypothetical protein
MQKARVGAQAERSAIVSAGQGFALWLSLADRFFFGTAD